MKIKVKVIFIIPEGQFVAQPAEHKITPTTHTQTTHKTKHSIACLPACLSVHLSVVSLHLSLCLSVRVSSHV